LFCWHIAALSGLLLDREWFDHPFAVLINNLEELGFPRHRIVDSERDRPIAPAARLIAMQRAGVEQQRSVMLLVQMQLSMSIADAEKVAIVVSENDMYRTPLVTFPEHADDKGRAEITAADQRINRGEFAECRAQIPHMIVAIRDNPNSYPSPVDPRTQLARRNMAE
jgi:hypothetical protein